MIHLNNTLRMSEQFDEWFGDLCGNNSLNLRVVAIGEVRQSPSGVNSSLAIFAANEVCESLPKKKNKILENSASSCCVCLAQTQKLKANKSN